METELKFQVPSERRAALLKAVATPTVQRTRLRAAYADTPDRRLAAAGLALRLRQEGRHWVQTLKGRGDGLVQRLEHEVRLPAQRGVPVLDPLRHAGTAAGEALLAVLGPDPAAAGLQTLYRTDIQRLHRTVRHASGALIEIAYDRGHLLAADQRQVVDEVEFELLRGPATALTDVAGRWAARHGLWWDVRTKSERGYRLALGLQQVPAVRAQPPDWPKGADAATVWKALLMAALQQVLPNAAEIAGGSGSPEHLHQLRVGVRRLRSVLRGLPAWGADAAAAVALEAAWREPFAALGVARDADVLRADWQPLLQALAAPLFEWPAAAEPGDAAAQLVRGPAFTQALLASLSLALHPGQTPATVAAADPEFPRPPGRLTKTEVMAALQPLWRRIRRDARGFAQAPLEEQHRLRKRIKRLRYLADMLLPLLPGSTSRQLLPALRQVLDEMGRFNDLAVAEGLFRSQAQRDPAAWFAAGCAAAWRADAVQRVQAQLRVLRRIDWS